MGLIKQLYELERTAKDQSYSHEQIRLLRQQQALPILHQLKEWLDSNVGATVKDSPIGEAIRYALKIWARLLVYITDGKHCSPSKSAGRIITKQHAAHYTMLSETVRFASRLRSF